MGRASVVRAGPPDALIVQRTESAAPSSGRCARQETTVRTTSLPPQLSSPLTERYAHLLPEHLDRAREALSFGTIRAVRQG